MNTVSSLELRRVRTRSGRYHGRVFDLRCELRGAEAVVTHLICGRRGLLERLGFREARPDAIEWSRVIEIRPGEILIAD